MSANESAPVMFERWWDEWGSPSKKLDFKDAKKALEELESAVEQYFSMHYQRISRTAMRLSSSETRILRS